MTQNSFHNTDVQTETRGREIEGESHDRRKERERKKWQRRAEERWVVDKCAMFWSGIEKRGGFEQREEDQ